MRTLKNDNNFRQVHCIKQKRMDVRGHRQNMTKGLADLKHGTCVGGWK